MDTLGKFNNEDRRLLIQELERIQGVTLEQLSGYQKLYKSSNGHVYLIQGGKEFWHGINKQIVNQLKEPEFQKHNSILVKYTAEPSLSCTKEDKFFHSIVV